LYTQNAGGRKRKFAAADRNNSRTADHHKVRADPLHSVCHDGILLPTEHVLNQARAWICIHLISAVVQPGRFRLCTIGSVTPGFSLLTAKLGPDCFTTYAWEIFSTRGNRRPFTESVCACLGCRERKSERIEQLQAQLQESEESVQAMQAEAATAKAKLREMELARMSAVQVWNPKD
jgi:hypothetical protein